jgi:hypothetical protein
MNTQTNPDPLDTHDPVTGNPTSLESLTTKPPAETSSNTTSPPTNPQTPNISRTATTPAIQGSITHMPACGHSTVPLFDGNALNLCLYYCHKSAIPPSFFLTCQGK